MLITIGDLRVNICMPKMVTISIDEKQNKKAG